MALKSTNTTKKKKRLVPFGPLSCGTQKVIKQTWMWWKGSNSHYSGWGWAHAQVREIYL